MIYQLQNFFFFFYKKGRNRHFHLDLNSKLQKYLNKKSDKALKMDVK